VQAKDDKMAPAYCMLLT